MQRPDGSASTGWNYAGLLCNLYSQGLERPLNSGTSSATILKHVSPSNPFFIWYEILLTGSHHYAVFSIPFLLRSNSSILPLLINSISLRALITISKLIEITLSPSLSPPYPHPIPSLSPPYSLSILSLLTSYSLPIPSLLPPYSLPIPQVRVTELVMRHIRVADTAVARLSGTTLTGISPGRTELQVLCFC